MDGWPRDVEGEGDSVALFLRAFRNFGHRRRILLASTPTTAGNSRIETAYEATDRRRYYVPCPHCEGFQVLKWSNVKWEKGKPETAHYVCEHCGCVIYNHEKTEMLARGEWRADVPNWRGTVIGFHLSALYSPVGWFSWGDAAKLWVEAQGNEPKLKQFINTVLGETWKVKGEVPDWEKIYKGTEDYEIGTVPAGGLFLTGGADVQKDRIEVEIVAYGRDKESWSVDYRILPGDTANINSDCWMQLDRILQSAFPHPSGRSFIIKSMAIDSGHNTQTVYNWCRKYSPDRVVPVKGMDSLSVILGRPQAVDVQVDGKRKKHAIKLWGVGVSHLKGELYGWLRLDRPGDDEPFPPGFCHFPEYDEEHFRQLTAEELIPHENKSTHQMRYEWVKIRDRNEVLDCRIYARAAAALLQIDKFQPKHWDALEAAVWGEIKKLLTTQPTPEEQRNRPVQTTRNYSKRQRGQVSSGVRI